MKENWGRWGDADESGALNLISEEQITKAAGLVRLGHVVELAQVISPALPLPQFRPNVSHFMHRSGADYAAGHSHRSGFQYADDTLLLPLHSGTHIDALCHCWYSDSMYNGFSAAEVRGNGARHLGVDKIGPIVTRGLLLDFVTLTGSPLEDGFTISAEMVHEALEKTGTTIQPGDAVLLRTGWQERQTEGGDVDFNAEPGIGLEAAMVLADGGAAIVGADNYSVEVLPFPEGTIFPVHQRLIRDFGIPLMEGLVLEPLAQHGATSFLFVCVPLKIKGGTGSPVNPVAIL